MRWFLFLFTIYCSAKTTLGDEDDAPEHGNVYHLRIHVCNKYYSGSLAGIKLRMYRDGEMCESPLLNAEHKHLKIDKWYNFMGIPCDQDWRTGIFDHIEMLEDGYGSADGLCIDKAQVYAEYGDRNIPFSRVRDTRLDAVKFMSENKWKAFYWDRRWGGRPALRSPKGTDTSWSEDGNAQETSNIKVKVTTGTMGPWKTPGKKKAKKNKGKKV